MPVHEFKCNQCGSISTKFFRSFNEADVEELECIECGGTATKQISLPFPAHLYGKPDGYHKPSPTKRHSHKLINPWGNKEQRG